ncbi:LysR family transcriptional regulator [Streptomyces sp. SAJ15]|uniref:LysR substrate-binding domain-containing protein n=1 Tax=Streptomyces sp. SAJ15 TaxID=2011095 RepID=UPI0011862DDD|nr:LysR family transcriptional regulator [Streptomyces sp. SAJ15]TVL89285.1 LysR family transcriptional regulator [Streptomyces sp. SAJ15]
MDLRLLSSFLAVVEEGHFGRAAARLFLSPPAVTQHVQRLESELGTRLVHRNPVSPTPAGARLVGHARTLLAAANAAMDDMVEAVREEKAGGGRPLRVGIMGHGSAELTPASISAYRRARPDVRVELRQLNFTEHVSALVEDRVDVAFVRPGPDDERIAADVLTTEQRIVAVPESSPIADARGHGVTVADIAELPFFRLPRHTPRPFTEYLYFNQEARRRGTDYAVTPQEVLTGVVNGRVAGSGLKSFARYYAWPGAVFVPVLDAPWQSSYLAVRARDGNPEVHVFRALTIALARELGPRISRAG